MKTFKLPDLGEGLPDAVIREWFVKEGDVVKVDQPLCAMETAKALVDVPSPLEGKIEKLFGQVNDTIQTGEPLVGFEGEGVIASKADAGTVVGKIEHSDAVLQESARGISPTKHRSEGVKATPHVRVLAKKLGVDLNTVSFSGDHITSEDVERAANKGVKKSGSIPTNGDMQDLTPARKAMAMAMADSHANVVPVTIVDDVDISHWENFNDLTLRVIRAMISAVNQEPLLNATYDGAAMRYHENKMINIALAIDSPHGLFVPVLKDVANRDDKNIREQIESFKKQAEAKTFSKDDLHGGTILLSNFGSIVGRYANPIITPPMVAILGVGRVHNRSLPLSLTFDHRLVNGGESARFLKALMDALARQ